MSAPRLDTCPAVNSFAYKGALAATQAQALPGNNCYNRCIPPPLVGAEIHVIPSCVSGDIHHYWTSPPWRARGRRVCRPLFPPQVHLDSGLRGGIDAIRKFREFKSRL